MHTSVNVIPLLLPMSVISANRTHSAGALLAAECECKCRRRRRELPLSAWATGGDSMPLTYSHGSNSNSLSCTLLVDLPSNSPLHSWAKQGKSCESNSQALSVSISSPSCLQEPTPWVNYPLWKSHLSSNPWARSFSGWCPLVFWTSLFLIGCDIYLFCMPQAVLSGFSLPGWPYLLTLELILEVFFNPYRLHTQ